MLDGYATIAAMIDLRAFSSLWYWVVVAGFWILAGRRVLDMPVDMLTRAHGWGGAAGEEFDRLAGIAIPRVLRRARELGPWLLALAGFALALVLGLGFGYGLELGQAAGFLLLPLVLIRLMEVQTARRLEHGPRGAEMQSLLLWHRFRIQLLGLVFILLTAFWGAWRTMTVGALGH